MSKPKAERQEAAGAPWDLLDTPLFFPIRRSLTALRARHQSGDPRVVALQAEDGGVDGYELRFTEDRKRELLTALQRGLVLRSNKSFT